nr:MAG TPA: hypothetical protein [Crassvirales sp.]
MAGVASNTLPLTIIYYTYYILHFSFISLRSTLFLILFSLFAFPLFLFHVYLYLFYYFTLCLFLVITLY